MQNVQTRMNYEGLNPADYRNRSQNCKRNKTINLVKISVIMYLWKLIRRVWSYQRGNQNPYIAEGQTIQWPKVKGETTIYKTYT